MNIKLRSLPKIKLERARRFLTTKHVFHLAHEGRTPLRYRFSLATFPNPYHGAGYERTILLVFYFVFFLFYMYFKTLYKNIHLENYL